VAVPELNSATLSASELLESVETVLRNSGIREWREEARWILEEILGSTYTSIRADLAPIPDENAIRRILECAGLRTSRIPLGHILGSVIFYGLRFHVRPGVLIPRPETEILVEKALQLIDQHQWSVPRILDCYTGCGNIAIAIAKERPQVIGTGLDIDPMAVSCAEENKLNLKTKNVEFLQVDVEEYLRATADRFHLVTANPPYVCSVDIPGLQREILDHENHIALDGGQDGLEHIRTLGRFARRVLSPDGFLLSEIGAGQRENAVEIFSEWKSVDFVEDFDGIPRVLVAQP